MSIITKTEHVGAFQARNSLLWACLGMVLAMMIAAAPPSAGKSDSSYGAHVYVKANCSACHGGLGYGGAGPRFRDDKLLSADTYVVGQILLGRGIMPAFADKLSDSEIAAVATYIRTSWGNDFGEISSTRVAEIRRSLSEENTPSSNAGKAYD